MMQSILVLGRQPALGLAELESLYGADAVSSLSPQIAALSLPHTDVSFGRIGGSTRMAEYVATVPSKLWKDVEKQLAKSVVEIAQELPEGKVQLGFSAYDIPITSAKLNATGLQLKKILRGKTGRSVRVTPNPELELNTAQVVHNHLTGPTGIEFLIIAAGNETIIARTIAVQDIESYTLRDRGRPKRDARVGMLPPKLAQIIINLASGGTETSTETIVLDPFCGTGVLLIEASLMGFGVYGTDLEPRMIDYSRANLEWMLTLPQRADASQAELGAPLEVGDATTHIWKPSPAIVAAETYLGRPFTEFPGMETIAQTTSEVNLILKKFLRNLHDQLQPGTRLCLAVPAWQIGADRFKHLPLVDSLEEMGYNRISFEHAHNDQLMYYREDQIVARELLVLIRK